jgi:hypothetical protein
MINTDNRDNSSNGDINENNFTEHVINTNIIKIETINETNSNSLNIVESDIEMLDSMTEDVKTDDANLNDNIVKIETITETNSNSLNIVESDIENA